MGRADVPGIKRAGLPVDLDRLTAEGDDWLSGEERYALKTHGICAQAQPGRFMMRIRTSGGTVSADTIRGLAGLADRYGNSWVHTTTRQQLELHHLAARDLTTVIAAVEDIGLTTSSTCGHTLRGVMSCPDAGVSLDEPFDCYPDARATSDTIVDRTPELNAQLPQRVNIGFGGCANCRDHARTNEAGYVSVVRDGIPGYELWVGGSLGKSMPTLGFQAFEFLPRDAVLPAAHALLDVFISHGEFDRPPRARLKHLIADMGRREFMGLYLEAFEDLRQRGWPEPQPVAVPEEADVNAVMAQAPEGGWTSGIRPQRTPGLALLTVNIPLGDLDSEDLRGLADVTEDVADGNLYLTTNQNVMFRDVPVDRVPEVRDRLATLRLYPDGADQARDVRCCTGGPVCSLALTPSTGVGASLLDHPALKRHSSLRIHVSGCMNACAQHQVADIGFSGSKVRIDGQVMLGYQIWLGGSPQTVGSVVGRVAESDVVPITDVIVGVWEALRGRGETLPETVERVGLEAFKARIGAVFEGRWEPGPDPEEEAGLIGLDLDRDREIAPVVA